MDKSKFVIEIELDWDGRLNEETVMEAVNKATIDDVVFKTVKPNNRLGVNYRPDRDDLLELSEWINNILRMGLN